VAGGAGGMAVMRGVWAEMVALSSCSERIQEALGHQACHRLVASVQVEKALVQHCEQFHSRHNHCLQIHSRGRLLPHCYVRKSLAFLVLHSRGPKIHTTKNEEIPVVHRALCFSPIESTIKKKKKRVNVNLSVTKDKTEC
jgi:hypothetical protein